MTRTATVVASDVHPASTQPAPAAATAGATHGYQFNLTCTEARRHIGASA